MAPPTSSAESVAPEGQQPYRWSFPAPFLTKIYQIVDDPALDNIISWNNDGSTFIVWRPAELTSELLPKLFKHSNFLSFLRQLNTYGFRKVFPGRWEFGNERFLRGQRHLLCDIRRRKVLAAAPPVTATTVTAIPVAAPLHSAEEHVLSSNSSSGVAVPREPPHLSLSANLIEENEKLMSEENERLRSENSKLKVEIGEMKGVCDRIMMLMSNYSASQQVGEVASAPELAFDEVEVPAGARLFGVMIGAKRVREEAGDEREVVVKSEAGSSEAVEAPSWVP